MRKIATVFERDWNGDRSLVTREVHPGCEWVLAGEGVARLKYDGACCLIRGGVLYKRHEVKPDKEAPEHFEAVERDDETGKTVGWLPVGDGPEDRWFREGLAHWRKHGYPNAEGTFELVGPKVQGNRDGYPFHALIPHAHAVAYPDAPRDFGGLKAFFEQHPGMEGLVFHHPDGRMAKIKARDFGLRR